MQNITSKKCGRCEVERPISQFNRDKHTKSGLRSQCVVCMKAERLRLSDHYRAWRQTPEKKDWYAAYRKENRDPIKIAARNAVNHAIASGRLIKPIACWHCGSTMGIVGHHPDYSNQLGVSWMCQTCHKQVHQIADDILSGCFTTQLQPT